jgi:hypothetical protein
MTATKAIVSILTKVLDFKQPPPLIQADCCERCGRSSESNRRTIGELATITLCGCVLLMTLTIAGPVAYRWTDCIDWIDRARHNLFDGPAWHEPLDEWIR